MTSERPKLLLGVTASVAAIKVPELVSLLIEIGYNIRVIATANALKFFSSTSLPVRVYTDEDEWTSWTKRGDPVLHIELRDWADRLLIAPLSANSLAKIANGLADNLLTTMTRAWWFPEHANDPFRKQVFFAPAMNVRMWDHVLTNEHVQVLTDKLGWKCIRPISKTLICGEYGIGAMADLRTIVDTITDARLKQQNTSLSYS